MTEKSGSSAWIGPVIGSIILIGGYVAYQQWHEHDQHNKQCAALKRQFSANTNSLLGPMTGAIQESKKRGNLSPMGQPSLVVGVAANQVVMDTLNAQCPNWIRTQYKDRIASGFAVQAYLSNMKS